jgi:hypothetical protein
LRTPPGASDSRSLVRPVFGGSRGRVRRPRRAGSSGRSVPAGSSHEAATAGLFAQGWASATGPAFRARSGEDASGHEMPAGVRMRSVRRGLSPERRRRTVGLFVKRSQHVATAHPRRSAPEPAQPGVDRREPRSRARLGHQTAALLRCSPRGMSAGAGSTAGGGRSLHGRPALHLRFVCRVTGPASSKGPSWCAQKRFSNRTI